MAIFRLLSFTQAPSPDSVGSYLPEGAFIYVTVGIARGRLWRQGGGRTRKKARPLSRPRPVFGEKGTTYALVYILFVVIIS